VEQEENKKNRQFSEQAQKKEKEKNPLSSFLRA
jgi:hypothetical protein